MASVIRSVDIDTSADAVWAAVKDFFHPDALAPGFVVEAHREGDERVVTLAHGATLREVLVGCDDALRRLSYTVTQGRSSHHNSSMQVLPSSTGCQLVWVTDVLPDELAGYIGENSDRGLHAIAASFSG